jgi:hypothetical protein
LQLLSTFIAYWHQINESLPGSPRDQYHILYDNGTMTLLNGSERFGQSFKVQAQIKVLMVCRSWQLGLMSLLQSWQLHCNWTLWNIDNHDEQPGVIFLPIAIKGSICIRALYFIQQWRQKQEKLSFDSLC